jgi:hypothetical protein
MGRRGVTGIVVAAAIASLPSAAVADEGITLLTGDTASVRGTSVTCVVQSTSIRCTTKAGLTATLSGTGKVQVTKGTRRLFPLGARARHLRLGDSDGFFVGGGAGFCHVYTATARTLSCYASDAKGGLAGTYGFDISDKSVVVFKFGKIQDRHDLKTFS